MVKEDQPTERITEQRPLEEKPQELLDLEELEKIFEGIPVLIVVKGPNRESRFRIDKERIMIGRAGDSDIVFEDITVSKRHAAIWREKDDFFIEDLNSLNGTYVNNLRIDKAALTNRDIIQIGRYRVIFMYKPKSS